MKYLNHRLRPVRENSTVFGYIQKFWFDGCWVWKTYDALGRRYYGPKAQPKRKKDAQEYVKNQAEKCSGAGVG